ncbi:hypothetical protein T440DRAFT_437404 [Plenodomus tracheiphilus IPT5]|uniref:Autophagy-related protein 29 n=1 Tax=Plenodomus tracheiphilus IPT5 TaxID=1408161 RepID=A0A6A7BMC9_9PLEO|nr:hypothetical protein T440DRAFT_437404 [Plenodomus tracheiphilus IPT5]
MSLNQFTVLIRLPFVRGNFEDPPQAQWDAEKDRQLWEVISKSSKTSDLNWGELAIKFQVPPTFLLQQAAWLYERHLDHVRNQMKKVSISNMNPSPSPTGGSTLTAVGGVAMRRGGSAGSGAGRTTSALLGRPKDSSSLRGGEVVAAPPLSRTPSTTTITQSRTQVQPPARTQSTRSNHRPNLSSRKSEDHPPPASTAPPPNYGKDRAESPDIPESSSSSSSSMSDTDHPAHRSQLFKRPPRFKQQRPRDLGTFEEGDGTLEAVQSGSQGSPILPFASAARRPLTGNKYAQDSAFRTSNRSERKALQTDRGVHVAPQRQKSIDQQSQATTETASSMTSSGGLQSAARSPLSPPDNHRAELARLGSPKSRGPRSRKDGSEGTPSMGSSFSDIDDAGISQSALEEALLSNMQHGRMSTLSRMRLMGHSHLCNINRLQLCLGTCHLLLSPTCRLSTKCNHSALVTASLPPSATMADPPVSDTTAKPSPSPPIKTTYTNDSYTISLITTYSLLKSLLAHPTCPHLKTTESAWPCTPCYTVFTTPFWTAAATLLDYFADFLPTDNPPMQSLWFHALDMWQSASLWPNHSTILDQAPHRPYPQPPHHTLDIRRARHFKKDYEQTLKLFETVIYGPGKMAKGSVRLSEDVIHAPDGVIWDFPGRHETGPWVSGVKPWAQWLGVGGLGVVAPPSASASGSRVHVDGDMEDGDGKGKGKEVRGGDGGGDGGGIKSSETTRHIPMPAIAIIQKHTQRARHWVLTLSSLNPDTVPETISRFDTHSLSFPRTGKTAPKYTALNGQQIRYTLVNGAPPVSRVPGLHDEDMAVCDPSLNLVDECVAVCRGEEVYVAQSGVPEETEGEDEDEDEEAEEVVEGSMDGWFDMWTVVESGVVVEEEKSRFAQGLGDVFEEWLWGEREQRVDRQVVWSDL